MNKDETFDEAFEFVKKVGLAAHKYGSTSNTIENYLNTLSKWLGYNGVFRSTPSEIVFALSKGNGQPQSMEIVPTLSPGLDLDKLARLGDVLNELKNDRLTLLEAEQKIDQIDKIPVPWGKFATLLGYAFTGAGLTPLLGGGLYDTLFATLISMLVYGIVLLTARMGQVAADWLPLTTAFFAGVVATTVKFWIPELNVILVIVSSIAVLVPGYTISLGAGELIRQRVISGMANLMNGLLCLVKQLTGGWLGVVLVTSIIPGITSNPSSPLSQTWAYGLLPLLLVGLNFSFQVSKRDFIWAILISAIAFAAVTIGGNLLDSNIGNVIGTAVAVVISTYWARMTGRPVSIVLLPAIILLVSGTIGFRGLAALAGGNLTLGVEQFSRMFVVAITVFAGILIGFTLVRPEKTL